MRIVISTAMLAISIGIAFGDAPATKPATVRVGSKVNEWLGIKGSIEAESEIKRLLLTPAELTPVERKQLISHLVDELNSGVNAQEMFDIFARGRSILKHRGDKNSQNMSRELMTLINDLAVEARNSAQTDPEHSYKFIRASFLLSCDEEMGKVGFSGTIVEGQRPDIAKLLKFDQPGQVPAEMRDSFKQWDDESAKFSDQEFDFESDVLDPISQKVGAPISQQDSDKIVNGIRQLANAVHTYAGDKFFFATTAGEAMRLARIRKNAALEKSLTELYLQLASETSDPVYARWLREAAAVDGEELGVMVGKSEMIQQPDGKWVEATRDSSGKPVPKK